MTETEGMILFEKQSIYNEIFEEEQIFTVHCKDGNLYRYGIRKEGNMLLIRDLSGKTLVEIVCLGENDITVMTEDFVQQGNSYVHLYACTNDSIEVICE